MILYFVNPDIPCRRIKSSVTLKGNFSYPPVSKYASFLKDILFPMLLTGYFIFIEPEATERRKTRSIPCIAENIWPLLIIVNPFIIPTSLLKYEANVTAHVGDKIGR